MLRRTRAFTLAVLLACLALVVPASAAQAAVTINWNPNHTIHMTAGVPVNNITFDLFGYQYDQGLNHGDAQAWVTGFPGEVYIQNAPTCVPMGAGTWMCVGTVTMGGLATKPGTHQVSVTGQVVNTTQTETFTVVVAPGTSSSAHSALEVTSGDRIADGADAHEITLRIRSSHDKPLAGLTNAQVASAVNLQLSGGSRGAFVEDTAAPGTYRARVTATTGGTVQVTADALGSPASLSFVSTYSAEHSTLAVSDGVRMVGGVDAHQVTLSLRDGNDVPLVGLSNAEVRSLTQVAVSAATLGSFSEQSPGVYTAAVTSMVAGTRTVTAQAAGAPKTVQFVFPVVSEDDVAHLPRGAQDAALGVLKNDSGSGIRVLSADLDDPDAGTIRLADGGADVLFSAAPGFTGHATVTYHEEDAFGYLATGRADLHVYGSPVVNGAEGRIAQGSTVQVDVAALVQQPDAQATRESDPDLRRPAEVAEVAAQHGTATLSDGVLTYTAAPGFAGVDTVTVTATDDLGQTGTGEVVVTVVAPPTLNDYAATVQTGTELVIDPSDLGVGPDLEFVSADPGTDRVTFERLSDGTFRHATELGYVSVDEFTVVFADDLGQQATSVVTVEVVPPPVVATADAADLTYEVVDAEIDVLTNDEGLGLHLMATSVDPSTGTVVVADEGDRLLFSAAPGFSGTTTVTYEVEDSYGFTAVGEVRVRVYALPALDTHAVRIAQDTSVEVDVAGLVLAPGAGLWTIDTTLRRPAKVTEVVAQSSAVTLSEGVLTYEAAPGFAGVDTVTVTATDDLGQTGTGEVTVTVVAPPVLTDYAAEVQAGNELIVTPADLGAGDHLEYVSTSGVDGPVTFDALEDGSFRHYAPEDYTGTDVFEVVYTDDLGQQGTAAVTVAVVERPSGADAGGVDAGGAGSPGLASTGLPAVGMALSGIALVLMGAFVLRERARRA